MSSIAEVETIGLTHKDSKEVVSTGTAVIIKEGHTLSIDSVRAFCKEHLIDFKIPKKIIIISKMPLNSRGKLDRAALKRLFE